MGESLKIIISGGAGYIGSYLASQLIKKHHEVRLIDNYYAPSNLTEIEGIPIENVDIREDIDISNYDILIHLAAISGIKTCDDNE